MVHFTQLYLRWRGLVRWLSICKGSTACVSLWKRIPHSSSRADSVAVTERMLTKGYSLFPPESRNDSTNDGSNDGPYPEKPELCSLPPTNSAGPVLTGFTEALVQEYQSGELASNINNGDRGESLRTSCRYIWMTTLRGHHNFVTNPAVGYPPGVALAISSEAEARSNPALRAMM
jgi:hypothetical protein